MLEFLSKFEFLNKIFRLGETRHTAKERLRLVLIHDRASVSPQMLESLKEDLIGLISKYLEIDVSSIEIGLEKKDGSIALAANIPIKGVRRAKVRAAEINSAEPARDVAKSTESQRAPDAIAPADSNAPGSSAVDVQKGNKDPAQKEAIPRSQRKKRTVSRTKRKTKRHSGK